MNPAVTLLPTHKGLTQPEAAEKLRSVGPNALPEASAPSLVGVFLRQFLSPLIYILVAAAAVSVVLSDLKDAAFIGAVLLANGIIGTLQEYSAGRAAAALRNLERRQVTVIRDSSRREIDARELVPGDLVILESGGRVPADMRLTSAEDLLCDESLLTGESRAVRKAVAPEYAVALDARASRVLAGTMVIRGRGSGLVTATGGATELGKIAEMIVSRSTAQPPLLIRLGQFSRTIALSVGAAVALLVVVGLLRNMGAHELFLMAVGLAVSAIPEGLPVAISVALAIGMRRMARVNVIVRNMPAIEALGSCTLIATDKTGTLTLNELTVTDVCLPDGTMVKFEPGPDLDACAIRSPCLAPDEAKTRAAALLKAAALPNEGRLLREKGEWRGIGDTVDIALLAAARKGGIVHEDLAADYPLLARIPYEPDLKYAASFHEGAGNVRIFVKGAPETLIAMADRMSSESGTMPIDRAGILVQKDAFAARGLRVLAFAEGDIDVQADGNYGHRLLAKLVFLGLAGMQDPLRPEVPDAIRACGKAGIEVAMITGDDPKTAGVIALQTGLVFTHDQLVTGDAVRRAEAAGEAVLDKLTRSARIYTRVEPAQKLAIVLSMARNGHFVAVTGDGVNDAPALKHAHVGVAMGKKGTDVAKESADIIVTDDNFASLVGGIREGRVAYANIRKVVFMTVSTGAAEVVLFLLAIPLGLPMPLLPVQLLWLNLVTNGIQDVALAAERAEGDELDYPPRRPREPIFDRVMMRRIWHSTLVMGVGGFAVFYWLLMQGYAEATARNLLLLLFVLFENFQTFNSRSERHSVFRQSLVANPLLVSGVVGAQTLHIGAMHVPVLSETLSLELVDLKQWALLLLASSSLLVAMEFEKWWDRKDAAPISIKRAKSK